MPSPFPGMDPYIEDPFFWSDFHGSLMGIMRETLNSILPINYVAAMERHVWVEEHDIGEMSVLGVPDVQVSQPRHEAEHEPAIGILPMAAPITAILPLTRRDGHRFLRILDRRKRRIVTIIEVLSPANKTETGYGPAYRRKRMEYLAGGVNLVEIDLLRAGDRPPLQEPPPRTSDYYILVCPATICPQAGFWPLSVRDLLPPVPIPLNRDEANIYLDLKACVDRAYDAGRYFDEIDYSLPPYLPLCEPDATWARELLANRAR
jgi:hypothetical protein